MEEKLTLNNGAELRGHLIETETRLFLYVWEKTMDELFDLLNNPENTKKITALRYGETQTVRGYKRLMSLSVEGGGMIAASLKKA